MRTLIALSVVMAASTTALAAPSFELVDRGDAVEVIAHDVTATTTTIRPTRQRLEVPVIGYPMAKGVVAHDSTVISVDFQGSSVGHVLSVKLVYDRNQVQTMARYAQAIQVGDDLHVIFPRTVPMAGAAVKLPGPTLSAELAAKAAAAAPKITTGEPVVAAPIQTPAPMAAPTPAPTPAAAATTPAAAPIGIPTPKPAPSKLGTAPEGNTSKLGLYGVAGLLLVGVGGYTMRKKKASLGGGAAIEVIAQRSIGPKAKIVWLSAGSREMVVAVTAQQVRMLGAWKKGETPTVPVAGLEPDDTSRSSRARELPQARTVVASNGASYGPGALANHAINDAVTRPIPTTTSPAVAGLLKLRGAKAPAIEPLVSDEVATGDLDADSLWAKEILSATSGMGRNK